MGDHSRTVCRVHGSVLEQCRCPGPKTDTPAPCRPDCPGRAMQVQAMQLAAITIAAAIYDGLDGASIDQLELTVVGGVEDATCSAVQQLAAQGLLTHVPGDAEALRWGWGEIARLERRKPWRRAAEALRDRAGA